MHALGVGIPLCRTDTNTCTRTACWHIPRPRKSRRILRFGTANSVRSRLEPLPNQAKTSGNGSYNLRQNTNDRDGTAGPQTQVRIDDRAALNSSIPRPPPAPSVVRSFDVPLWGAASGTTLGQDCVHFCMLISMPTADAMKFNGPAPEIINGRLAMLGILAAAVNESAYTETVIQQVQHTPLRVFLVGLFASYSSLIPILKGAKSEAFGECVCYTANALSVHLLILGLSFSYLTVAKSQTTCRYCRRLHSSCRDHQCSSSHAWFCNTVAVRK